MNTPSKVVKERFGDKQKLLDALKPFLGEDLWVSRENGEKGLSRVSNAKLVRLYDTFSAVQSKWGTRSKLIDAIVDAEGKQKEAGFRARIEGWPVPRLYDRWKSASRRRTSGEAVKAAPVKEAKADKPKASATAAAKPAAKKTAKKSDDAPKSKKPAAKKSTKSGK